MMLFELEWYFQFECSINKDYSNKKRQYASFWFWLLCSSKAVLNTSYIVSEGAEKLVGRRYPFGLPSWVSDEKIRLKVERENNYKISNASLNYSYNVNADPTTREETVKVNEHRKNRPSNTTIYKLTETAPLVVQARTRQLKLMDRILRLPDDETAKEYALYVNHFIHIVHYPSLKNIQNNDTNMMEEVQLKSKYEDVAPLYKTGVYEYTYNPTATLQEITLFHNVNFIMCKKNMNYNIASYQF